ncbi:MAG: type IV secretion system protein DotC [Alphaproteobacteria bacterium]|nr:type IV secretion system protein DotC [Alphaproteobacteria bacterium]
MEGLTEDSSGEIPPNLLDLQEIPGWQEKGVSQDEPVPFNIRKEAMKEAALSFGARGGLARRTFEIRAEIERRRNYLDKVYDFRQLLIAAPSGLVIEPPIVSESLDALLISNSGTEAAVADTIYNINRNARIVSAARTWRQYLERDWGKVEPPPDILRPRDNEERQYWRELISQGWAEGYKQADEVFEQDLLELNAHFQGMVRYKQLLAKGMITPPYTMMVDRGVSGGGEEMKVGDRAIRMTGLPTLTPRTKEWQPVNP